MRYAKNKKKLKKTTYLITAIPQHLEEYGFVDDHRCVKKSCPGMMKKAKTSSQPTDAKDSANACIHMFLRGKDSQSIK